MRVIQGLEALARKRENLTSAAAAEKVIALSAWRRVDRRTREALRRNFLPDLVHGYEVENKYDISFSLSLGFKGQGR